MASCRLGVRFCSPHRCQHMVWRPDSSRRPRGQFSPVGSHPGLVQPSCNGNRRWPHCRTRDRDADFDKFHRRRWPWFTRWVGAGFGFLLGFAPQFIFGALNPSANPRQIPGSITLCTGGHCTTEIITPAPGGTTWEINGHWLLAGWAHVAADAVVMGSLGLATAVVFCVIAFRSAR